MIALILLTLAVNSTNLTSLDNHALDNKSEITRLEKMVLDAQPDKKSEIKFNLAKVYLKDQDQEKAFASFLEALDASTPKIAPPVSDQEQKLYDEALARYLDHRQATSKVANALLNDGEKILKEHPEYLLLNYILSLSYANKGQYVDFFNLFFHSYPYYQDHYLAYKTKAILLIKLFERARTKEEKEQFRQGIIKNIDLALQKNERDSTLYRPAIAFASGREKEGAIKKYLKKMVDTHIVIPRADLLYYVQEAISYCQLGLAEELITETEQWYPNSRTVMSAKEYIESLKK